MVVLTTMKTSNAMMTTNNKSQYCRRNIKFDDIDKLMLTSWLMFLKAERKIGDDHADTTTSIGEATTTTSPSKAKQNTRL